MTSHQMSARRRRRAVGGALGALTLALVAAWALPRVSAAADAWLHSAPIRAKEIRVGTVRVIAGGAAPTAASAAPGAAATAGAAPGAAAAGDATGAVASPTVDAGFTFDMVAVLARCPLGLSRTLQVRVRTSTDGIAWSEWWTLSFDGGGRPGSVESRLDVVSEPAWVGSSRYLQYEVVGGDQRSAGSPPSSLANVRFSFVNAVGDASVADRVVQGVKGVVAAIAGVHLTAPAEGMTTKPTIVLRAAWGANDSWRKCNPDYAQVKMAFVHHTAGSNDYTPAQSAAIVRGIYYYHTHVDGWNDIGYEFLIDRYGTIFEGRYGGITRGPIGAQVYGFNTSSTGISVIGDFSYVAPPPAAIKSLEQLLAWKLDVHHVNPLGTATMLCRATQKFRAGQHVTLPVIAGHRQANYTACPGDAFYRLLPAIRTAVAGMGLPKIYDFGVSGTAISPNGDGRGDTVAVHYTNSESDDWSVEIRASDGTLVRAFDGTGTTASVVWDGRDGNGVVVPDGEYALSAGATSARGTARPGTATILVDTVPPTITAYSVGPPLFSPNGDGITDTVAIKLDTPEVYTARISIVRPGGGLVRRVLDWAYVGAGKHTFRWDGMAAGSPPAAAADGAYVVETTVRDRAGNVTAAAGVPVQVDRTLGFPAVKPVAFSPNGDKARDTTRFAVLLANPATFNVAVIDAGGTPVRTFALGAPSPGVITLKWDGRDDGGTIVPQGAYKFVATATDTLGTISVNRPVTVDLTKPVLTVPPSLTLALGGAAKITYSVKDPFSPLVRVTAVVRRASGRIVKTFDFGWVRTGTGHLCVFKPSTRARYTVTFRATDAAWNLAVAQVTTVVVK
jgi:flagellar hook assembly protein FlgD